MTVESSVPVGNTGDELRTFAQTTSEGIVQTEAVALADTTDATQVARVKSEAPASDDAGLVVRVAGGVTTSAQVTIDESNSTTALLGAGATFTGSAVDVSGYQAVILQGYSDRSSATEGVKVQSSTDGTNWDHEHAYTLTGGSSLHIEETLTAKFYRVVYVNNGSQAQATFRLQAKLLTTAATAHVHGLAHPLTDNHPAPVVRAVLTGRSTAGGTSYVNVKVNPSGNLAVGTASVGTIGATAPTEATYVGVLSGSNLVGMTQPLTDTQLRATAVPVTDSNLSGTWDYRSGVSGTPTIPANAKIIQISAAAGSGGASFTINAGSTVTIPPNQALTVEPKGNLVTPTLAFTDTLSYFVEFVT